MPSESEILDSMRHIMDPDLGRDIVSLGFIKNLEINGGNVTFMLELTTPACPLKSKFREACEQAVMAVPGVEAVDITVGARGQRAHGPEQPGIDTLAQVGAIVAVSSCKGGVGKSTIAAHLARSIRKQGLKVGLLDADVYGPSVPTLFDTHNPQVYAENNLILPLELEGLKVMSLGFLLGESPAVLRGPLVSSYIQQVVRQTNWGELDYLLIDLPPGTGDIVLTLVQTASLDGAVIVTTPQTLSLVDVARGILMFEKVQVPVLGVVENMCSYTCPDCGSVHYPFGRSKGGLQKRFGIQTMAELPIAPVLSTASLDEDAEVAAQVAALTDNLHRAIGKTRVERQAAPEVAAEGNKVTVRWPDGHERSMDAYALRCACPCALCVDEHSGQRILDPDSVPKDISVESVQHLGNYAVAFEWSDGHSTGIYAWDYLREL